MESDHRSCAAATYFPGPVISNLAHAGPSPVIFSLAHVGIQYYIFIITLECTVSAYLKKKVCEAECHVTPQAVVVTSLLDCIMFSVLLICCFINSVSRSVWRQWSPQWCTVMSWAPPPLTHPVQLPVLRLRPWGVPCSVCQFYHLYRIFTVSFLRFCMFRYTNT